MYLGDGEVTGHAEQKPSFCWAALVARVLHPIDVQIIEALDWSERSLSAGDLKLFFDGEVRWRSLCRHLRRLVHLEAIEFAEVPTIRRITCIRYRLVQRPRSGH
jgi:hypothetical protein